MPELKMYHAEQKERFFTEAGISAPMEKLFRNVFDFTAPYEEEKGADICTWTDEEVKRIYELLSGFRSYSSNNRVNLIKRYLKWCVDSGIQDASGGGLEIRADGMKKFREMTLAGPEHLQKCLDAFLLPEDESTTDNIQRGFCWLAFAGLADDEIVEITRDDVDLDRAVVSYRESEYPLYPQAMPCMRILKESTDFKYSHPGYEKDFIMMPRQDGNKLLRGLKNAEPTVLNLRSKLSQKMTPAYKAGKLDVKISSYRVWISGQFYRMYEREQAGEPVDFGYLADRTIQMKEASGKQYSLEKGNRSLESKRKSLSTDYRTDYERWKAIYAV